jgi:hypothetical protein
LVFAALCGLHQYLLAYACGLEVGWGDFIPYVLILAVIGGELKTRLLDGSRGLARLHAALLVPATLALDPEVAQLGIQGNGFMYSLIPGFMALFAGAICAQAWRWGNRPVGLVAVLWGAAAVAAWGVGTDSQTLNIASAVGFLAAGWTVIAVATRDPLLLMGTPLAGSLAILSIPQVQVWMWTDNVDPRALYGVVLGVAWLATHAAFPRLLPAIAAGMGGTALAVGAMGVGFVPGLPLDVPIATAVGVAAICGVQAWWTRCRVALYPGMAPAGLALLWLLDHHRAWMLVPAAFALLYLGARWSRRTALAA